MAFKFYIVDPDQGEIFGTDSTDVAKEAAEDDALFVIDAEEALFMRRKSRSKSSTSKPKATKKMSSTMTTSKAATSNRSTDPRSNTMLKKLAVASALAFASMSAFAVADFTVDPSAVGSAKAPFEANLINGTSTPKKAKMMTSMKMTSKAATSNTNSRSKS